MAKIRNSVPKGDKTLDITLTQDGWTPMKEPKNFVNALLLSVPFMIINALISIGIINIFSDISLREFGLTTEGVFITIDLVSLLLIIFLVILHELIHLIFIPNFIKSEKTWIGLTLFGGFVATEEEISKSRCVLITIAPFFYHFNPNTASIKYFRCIDNNFKMFNTVELNGIISRYVYTSTNTKTSTSKWYFKK